MKIKQLEKINSKINDTSGFTLIEVLIAMTIFTVFATMYVTSQGGNVADSTQMREEVILKSLAEQVINEIIIDPPELTDALLISKESKSFSSAYEKYKYDIEYKKIIFPDLNKIMGSSNEDQESDDPFQKSIFENVKKNMEKMIWQVQVTITNKETNFNYIISSWLFNHEVKVELNY